jgi:tRNA (adenine22-N1)-methyltransferase
MALSQRLKQIDRMVTQRYNHIWDCCCDHGYLGLELLSRDAADTLHFVDVVPELMIDLKEQLRALAAFKQEYRHWQVHCIDVAQLPIGDVLKNDTHLIIIAGVGGELIIKLVGALLRNNPESNLEFLLCPVYHQYKLRQSLINWNMQLQAEHLLRDKGRFYEVLHVTTDVDVTCSVSPVGSSMWDFKRLSHRDYRSRMLEHFDRMAKSAQVDADAMQAANLYRALR